MAIVMRSRQALSARDERGQVIPLVALMLVAVIIMTAIAVDGGNARQNRREAQAAADAGALAGAKSQDTNSTNPQPPTCATDINCVAAYYTFESAGIQTSPLTQLLGASRSTSCTARIVKDANGNNVTEVCYVYTVNGKTVTVTTPYSFNGAVPSTRWVHVKACWNSPNAFGKVANISLFSTCGSATAENTGAGGNNNGVQPPATQDCVGEDNFADNNDNPTIIPAIGTIVHAGTVIGAHFHSHEATSALDPNSIVFKGPLLNADGTVTPNATIPYNNDAKHGYKLSKIPPYNPLKNGQDVDITYAIPNAPPLQKLDASGNRVVYAASLHAADTDQDHAPLLDCGNANWSFTYDGKGVTGSCGENSFLAGGVFPNAGQTVSPGTTAYARYSDESPIQSADVAVDQPNLPHDGTYGIDFKLAGPGFTDANDNPYQIPPYGTSPPTIGGYTLPTWAGTDKFNTQLTWTLPSANDPRWVNGTTYTLSLTAYDTDNNKPGNDCGVASWSFIIQGATNGKIHLIE
jgi:Flp pilus assembly protein TadG